jgi:IS5 family transposase
MTTIIIVMMMTILEWRPQSSDPTSEENSTDSDSAKTRNKGKLILNATCALADIAYPTDLGLLNKAPETYH